MYIVAVDEKMKEEAEITEQDPLLLVDDEPPFFRCCLELEEANNSKEVENDNSKDTVLALKVNHSPGEDRYILTPRDNTQDDEEELMRVTEWIMSRHISTVQLTDVLSNFPGISMVLAEDIMELLVIEGILSRAGSDIYIINKQKASTGPRPNPPRLGLRPAQFDLPLRGAVIVGFLSSILMGYVILSELSLGDTTKGILKDLVKGMVNIPIPYPNYIKQPNVKPPKPTQPKHFSLVLQWPNSFLIQNRIQDNGRELYTHFLIHGLWPDFRTTPADAFTFRTPTALHTLADAHTYWPNLWPSNGRPQNDHNIRFWKREWEHHGFYSGLTQDEYITATLQLYRSVHQTLDWIIDELMQYEDYYDTYTINIDRLTNDVAVTLGRPRLMCIPVHRSVTGHVVREIHFNVTVKPEPTVNDHSGESNCRIDPMADLPMYEIHGYMP